MVTWVLLDGSSAEVVLVLRVVLAVVDPVGSGAVSAVLAVVDRNVLDVVLDVLLGVVGAVLDVVLDVLLLVAPQPHLPQSCPLPSSQQVKGSSHVLVKPHGFQLSGLGMGGPEHVRPPAGIKFPHPSPSQKHSEALMTIATHAFVGSPASQTM